MTTAYIALKFGVILTDCYKILENKLKLLKIKQDYLRKAENIA